jgi:hypothetical protein
MNARGNFREYSPRPERKFFLRLKPHETPQYPIRCAQEPRLAKSPWLAPRSRFVIVEVRETVSSLAAGQFIAACISISRGIESLARSAQERNRTRSWTRKRATPNRPRSRRAPTCARLLGVRTHAHAIFGAIAGLPTRKVLALSRRRNPCVDEVSARRTPCCLTQELHSRAT